MMECQKEEGEGNAGTARHRETAAILLDVGRFPVCATRMAETRNKMSCRLRFFAQAWRKFDFFEINNF